MEFMKKRYRDIGQRVKKIREDKGLTQEDLYDSNSDLPALSQNVISSIEKGEPYNKNQSLISRKGLIALAKRLEVQQEEIIFGDTYDINTFVRELFYQVATNIYPNEENFEERLLNSASTVQNAMKWSGALSYIMTLNNYKGMDYYEYNSNLISDDIKKYYPFIEKPEKTYEFYLSILWNILEKQLINSFVDKILGLGEFDFLTLDNKIISWLSKDISYYNGFISVIRETENRLKKIEFFSIGFEVDSLSSEIRRIEGKTLFNDKEKVGVKYHSVSEHVMNRVNFMTSMANSFDGNFDLRKIKFANQGYSSETKDSFSYSDFINNFEDISRKNLDKGEQLAISSLFSDQEFLISNEKYISYRKLAKSLIAMQEKYLLYLDLDEIKRISNI
ncbi:hypothetical protein SFB93_13440 [Kurthia gibsonii]|uniref:helix-turn-helix domain-containing protein n=1 Tax=Kurthia gibsonii TaxID=33946 RepID=UPI003983B321